MKPRAIAVPLAVPGNWQKVERFFGSTCMPLYPMDDPSNVAEWVENYGREPTDEDHERYRHCLDGWFAVYSQIGPKQCGWPVFVKGDDEVKKAQAAAQAEAEQEAGRRAWENDDEWPLGRYARYGIADMGQERYDYLCERWAEQTRKECNVKPGSDLDKLLRRIDSYLEQVALAKAAGAVAKARGGRPAAGA